MLMVFKLNQEHIASHHCENIDHPELECNGTCFLNKKMKESHDHKKEDPIPYTFTDKTNLLFLTPRWIHPAIPRLGIKYRLPLNNEYVEELIWSSRLFRPPDS